MLKLTRGLRPLACAIQKTFFSSVSFDALTRDHKTLINDLQKIAEADRKFISYEPEIFNTRVVIADIEEMHACYDGDEESQEITKQEMQKSLSMALEMEKSMAQLNASKGMFTTAYLDFHSGSGGEDASDWTRMLFEMYKEFCKKMNWKCDILSFQNEGSGLRNGILRVQGETVSVYLSQETGIHRLVRLSPFDKSNRRHTSFASVSLTPASSASLSRTSIRPQDLSIDRFRSSGPGGQHVNKTESAVRLTHIPTGLVAECQSERNQHQNMDIAMDLLQTKLNRKNEEKEELKKREIHENKDVNSWSSQIRSYVLHPYTMVKDHLFDVSDSDVQSVLNGNLMEFLDELMRRKMYSDYGLASFSKG